MISLAHMQTLQGWQEGCHMCYAGYNSIGSCWLLRGHWASPVQPGMQRTGGIQSILPLTPKSIAQFLGASFIVCKLKGCVLKADFVTTKCRPTNYSSIVHCCCTSFLVLKLLTWKCSKFHIYFLNCCIDS